MARILRPCLECRTAFALRDQSRCGPCHQRLRTATYNHPDYRSLPRPSGKCQLGISPRCTGHATTWDHIVPLSKGGSHDRCNLRGACRPCNSARRDRG